MDGACIADGSGAAHAPCPFHGLVGHRLGVMAGGPSGNACALEMAHAPCRMETAGYVPDWYACTTWNVPQRADEVAMVVEGFVAFPDDARPDGADAWSGIPVSEWFASVTGSPFGMPREG